MDVHLALREQYHAGLAMLRQCIERCPEEVWTSGRHPRTYWRIAFHAIFFTHLYLGQTEDDFRPWPGRPIEDPEVWHRPCELWPSDPPDDSRVYTRTEVLDYLDYVASILDDTVSGLDLESTESGIPWYKDISKLSHEMLNIRHLQGHVGQLSELLMLHDIDIDWISKPR